MKTKIKIARGKHPCRKPPDYSSLLLKAMQENGKKLLTFIDEYIHKGANPNAVVQSVGPLFDSYSPLMVAATHNNPKAMIKLIGYGADFTKQNHFGYNALQLLWDYCDASLANWNTTQTKRRDEILNAYCTIFEVYLAESYYCNYNANFTIYQGGTKMLVRPICYVAKQMKKIYPNEMQKCSVASVVSPVETNQNNNDDDEIYFDYIEDSNEEDPVISHLDTYWSRLFKRIEKNLNNSSSTWITKWYRILNMLPKFHNIRDYRDVITLTLVCKDFALHLNYYNYCNFLSHGTQATFFHMLPEELFEFLLNLTTHDEYNNFKENKYSFKIGMHLTLPESMPALANFRNFLGTKKYKKVGNLSTVCKYFAHTIDYRNHVKPNDQQNCDILKLPTSIIEKIIDIAYGQNSCLFQRNINYINALQ